MKLVVDSSESFSFFNARSKARELSLQPALDLYAPAFSMEELLSKKHKIIESFALSETQFISIIGLLKTVIDFVEIDEYGEHVKEASDISPDPEDTEFFALALKLNCPIWSEDRLLKEQARIPVLSTKELKKLV
ncbi:MAG: hypothetical protein JW724_05695 [Candidatus Altiarchaeota archaeon]|nr:hypothetical protein [Candidatus Altiarchaeota archaeon]